MNTQAHRDAQTPCACLAERKHTWKKHIHANKHTHAKLSVKIICKLKY